MGLGALQPGHLIVILVIVLLIFGPGKLPELGKAVGDGLRELKKATSNEDKDAAPATLPAAPVATAPTPISAATSTGPVTTTTTTTTTRVCPSCRGAVTAGDKFCGNCGASMDVVSRSA